MKTAAEYRNILPMLDAVIQQAAWRLEVGIHHVSLWAFGIMQEDRFVLTHLPLEKLAVILQTMFSYAMSWMNSFLHSGRRPTGAKRPSAGCPECICNRPRPWRRPCVSDWGCGAVILLSRGEFGREKNKICYQRGCVWTFCYMPNLWYNIVILQHIFILRNNRCERSYFVFNLGSFARNREWETQVCVFGVFFLNIC